MEIEHLQYDTEKDLYRHPTTGEPMWACIKCGQWFSRSLKVCPYCETEHGK